jgi:hypothetical protein
VRMVFNAFEMEELRQLHKEFSGNSEIIDKDDEEYLAEQDLLRFQRNYVIEPLHLSRRTGAQNVVLINLVGPSLDLLEYVTKVVDCLTLPFHIHVDFGMLLYHPIDEEYRYLWAQRSTSLPIPSRVYVENDRHLFLSKFSQLDITAEVVKAHATQSQFTKSGFNFKKFLTVHLFLSKKKV